MQRYSQSIYGYYQYRDKPASLIHILFFMFEGAKILNFTLHHIISAKGVTAAKVRGRKYIRNRSTIEFLGLGKPNITRILKCSNLTTLEKRLDYQHLQ